VLFACMQDSIAIHSTPESDYEPILRFKFEFFPQFVTPAIACT